MFCREIIRDLRRAREANVSDYPSLLFVHMNDVATGDRFFAEHAPEARAIADPERTLYDAFGVKRGSLRQLAKPAVWMRGIQAIRKGARRGRVRGDARVMPGLVLIENRRIVWEHRFDHAGDNPDVDSSPWRTG